MNNGRGSLEVDVTEDLRLITGKAGCWREISSEF